MPRITVRALAICLFFSQSVLAEIPLSEKLARLAEVSQRVEKAVASPGPDSAFVFQGRLTTESGVPISTIDRVAQSTVYFTPFQGSRVAVYNGSRWILLAFSQLSLPLSGLVADTNYDVFVYDNGGALALELSAAWSTNTARSGNVTLFQGIYTLAADRTRRYAGTIRTTSTNTTEDSSSRRFVWNYYNRTRRYLHVSESADSWSYTTNTVRQTNGNASNVVEFISGINEEVDQALTLNVVTAGTTLRAMDSCIGNSSIAAQNATLRGGEARSTRISQLTSTFSAYTGIGYDYFSWNERGSGGTFFYGDDGGDDRVRSGLLAWVED